MNRPAGASTPVTGSYRSPAGSSSASRAGAGAVVVRDRASTRAARFADGREKEYAIAISSKVRSA
ncbi:hypothetical protein GCM10019017_68550 [Streptomyces showdoensis]